MNEGSDAMAGPEPIIKAKDKSSFLKEIGYWALFSVVVALAQLWLIPLAYYLFTKPFRLVELIGNGSLLFFATTTTSKTAGEYFKKIKQRRDGATLICVAVMLVIIFVSVFVYALEIATRLGNSSIMSLSPERVTNVSVILAVSALIFSLSYTIYIREFGE